MSFSRHVCPSIRYSLSPDRNSRGDLDLLDFARRVAVDLGSRLPARGPRDFLAELFEHRRRDDDVAETETHFRGAGGLARIGAVEDDVFHLVAAQALGALFAKHPRERVGHVALTAAVGSDDGGDATVECQLGSIREGLEA